MIFLIEGVRFELAFKDFKAFFYESYKRYLVDILLSFDHLAWAMIFTAG